jgi:hypothetical protein
MKASCSKMKIISFVVLSLVEITSGYAQNFSPNNIDLRATYCVAFHNFIVSQNLPILNDERKFAGLYGTQFVDDIRASTASSENNLSRLRGYMLPRLKFLDAESLLLAANQFPKDYQFLQSCQKKCSDLDCMNICPTSTGYQEKVSWCTNLNWIPF